MGGGADMGEVLEKAGILLFISVLSYGLKRAGLFHAADYKPFSRLVMNVTLPCAAITAFSQGFRQDGVFFWATCFGLAGNILMAFLGWCISRKKNKTDKGFWILTASGYNVGAFTMPFVQGFLSPVSMVAACMFDIGNAILCTGGTYAFLNIVVLGDVKEKGRLKAFVRTFFSSVSVDTYFLLLLLAFLHIEIPSPVLHMAQKIGDANGCMAMFAVGLMFEIPKELSRLKKALSVVLVRMGVALCLAAVFYFCLPLPAEIRQALAICVLAPVAVTSMLFAEKVTGDGALASLTGSLSILCSVPLILTVLLLFA